jgi:hypothetical protein
MLFVNAYMVNTDLAFSLLLVEVTCILKEEEGGNILLCDMHELAKIIVI